MTYQQIIEQLQLNSSDKYKAFNDKISNSGVLSIGCTVPFLRAFAKSTKMPLDEVITLPTNVCYEVDMLKGIIISTAKLPFADKKLYLDYFVNTIENWAVCDSNTVKVPVKERQAYFDYFSNLSLSKRTFVARYGLSNIMNEYLDDEHIDAVFQLLTKVTYGEYYVDMMVAWLVATAMAKCRDKTVEFCLGTARKVLPPFCYNKALQKMRDSYRISDTDKQWTYTLKM